MSSLFDEVRKQSVSERIIEQVRNLILDGKLTPGQKLPSERELAEQFNVGRSSVREATSAMIALGMVEIRPGDGVYIHPDFPQSILQRMEWSSLLMNGQSQDLVEARIAIERTTARLAAMRATDEQRVQLADIVEQMAAEENLDIYIELDLKFHMVLAEASQNTVLRDILLSVQMLMRGSMIEVLQHSELKTISLEQHRGIAKAVACADAVRAEEVMLAHLRKDADYFAKQA